MVLPTSQLLSGEEIGGWHPIRSKGTSGKKHGELNFSLKYVSKINLTQSYEVDCYFPVHTHCGVTLYQVLSFKIHFMTAGRSVSAVSGNLLLSRQDKACFLFLPPVYSTKVNLVDDSHTDGT